MEVVEGSYHWPLSSTAVLLVISELGVMRQFGIENHKPNISSIHKDFLSYTKFSNSPEIAILHTICIPLKLTTYYLTNPILCHYIPPVHLFLA